MDQEERIERIERGHNAVAARAVLLEPYMEARDKIIGRLVSFYRSGHTEHDLILGGIAEIAALDGLMAELERTITQGNLAAQQEYK